MMKGPLSGYYNEKIERELKEYKVEIERRFNNSYMNTHF
jgi:hypothetical protein